MKRIGFLTILFCFSAALCFGQKSEKTPAPPVKSKLSPVKTTNPKHAQAAINKSKQTQVKTDKSKQLPVKTDKLKQTPVKIDKSKQTPIKTSGLKSAPVKIDKPKQPVKTSGAKQPEAKTLTATKILKPTAVKPKPAQVQPTDEISTVDWKSLAVSLTAEDWDKSASLSSRFINRLKIENEKKQLAQLRYLYLYSLAGKILGLSAAKNTGGEKAVRDELRKAAATFAGKEFVLPARRFLGDCRKVFNYICAVRDNDRALRTTATGKNGTEIHSFDYVLFDEKVATGEFAENKTFLGGMLRKIEFNDDLTKPWVMRLIFDKGFVRVVGE